MDNKLMEKINKLLQLSKSTNENEAKTALLKAQELLVKHKLTMQDIEGYVAPSKVTELDSEITFKKSKWKGLLAVLFADNFGCKVFCRTLGTHKLIFLGREEDVNVCRISMVYAIDTIKNEANKLKKDRIKNHESTKGIQDDFALGFIKGLRERFDEQKAKNNWGLILVTPQDVTDKYNEMSKTFRKKSLNVNGRYNGNAESYEQGYQHGRKFSVSDKVAEGTERLQLG